MMDDTDDTDTDMTDAGDTVTEQPERRPLMPDPYVMAFNLIAIASNPRIFKARLREVRQAEAAAASRLAEADVRAAELDAREQKIAVAEAEILADRVKLREGEVELANKKDTREDRLREREERISELEHRWAFVGEDDDQVHSGFRQAEFSALMRARAAYGRAHDHGLDDISKAMAEKFPSRTVRHDPSGIAFPDHVSLSRTETEPPPAAGARVRPSRRGTTQVAS
jgi:hypothetical protein